MMSTSFNLLKYVDDKSRDLAFGYIRTMENKLQQPNQFEIPREIKNLCLMYYFEFEQFYEYDETVLKVSSSSEHRHNDIVQQIATGCWYSVYTRFIIDPEQQPNAIYIWRVQFTRPIERYKKASPAIGIVSAEHNPLNSYCFMSYDHQFYCWQTAWQNARTTKQKGDSTLSPEYGGQKGLDTGDIVTIELDIKNKWLRFYLNDRDLGIAHENINMDYKYKLGISFAHFGHKMQLLDFVTK